MARAAPAARCVARRPLLAVAGAAAAVALLAAAPAYVAPSTGRVGLRGAQGVARERLGAGRALSAAAEDASAPSRGAAAATALALGLLAGVSLAAAPAPAFAKEKVGADEATAYNVLGGTSMGGTPTSEAQIRQDRLARQQAQIAKEESRLGIKENQKRYLTEQPATEEFGAEQGIFFAGFFGTAAAFLWGIFSGNLGFWNYDDDGRKFTDDEYMDRNKRERPK